MSQNCAILLPVNMQKYLIAKIEMVYCHEANSHLGILSDDQKETRTDLFEVNRKRYSARF